MTVLDDYPVPRYFGLHSVRPDQMNHLAQRENGACPMTTATWTKGGQARGLSTPTLIC